MHAMVNAKHEHQSRHLSNEHQSQHHAQGGSVCHRGSSVTSAPQQALVPVIVVVLLLLVLALVVRTSALLVFLVGLFGFSGKKH